MTKPLPEERKRAYRPRRQFTPEFRAKAVALVLQGTQTLPAVARDLDLNPGLLHNWIRFHQGQPTNKGPSTPIAQLVEQLHPENLAKFHAGKPKKKAPKPTALVQKAPELDLEAVEVHGEQLSLAILEEQDQKACQQLKRIAIRLGYSMQELVNSLMELAMMEGVRRRK